MESIKESLSAVTELFNNKMVEFQNELQKTNPAPVSTSSLHADFLAFRTFIMTALETLQKQVEFLALEVDSLEMRARRKMLLFHGIPEAKNENTSTVVSSFIVSKVGLPEFTQELISRSQRLGRQSHEKPRPLLVKFNELAVRNKVWFTKTKLKGTGFTLSEFLTKKRHSLFLDARRRFGVNKCWTRDGNIYVMGADGSHHNIVRVADLDQISFCNPQVAEIPTQPTSSICNRTVEKLIVRPKRTIKK